MARPNLRTQLEGKRFTLGLRVTEDRRRKLELAAQDSGRSISQEIELRLEKSFWDDQVMGGEEMMALFRMMAGAAMFVQNRIRTQQPEVTWLNNPSVFQAVRRAWLTIIDGVGPAGQKSAGEKFDWEDRMDEWGLIEIIRQGMEYFPRSSSGKTTKKP
jgi:hypothetical protein